MDIVLKEECITITSLSGEGGTLQTSGNERQYTEYKTALSDDIQLKKLNKNKTKTKILENKTLSSILNVNKVACVNYRIVLVCKCLLIKKPPKRNLLTFSQ